ncbi:FkbM family methyltransferase [bacterium]|nr:FkbM family methyltransferase [bacterium]
MSNINKILLKALFKHWNHYPSVLPYNLNWMIKLRKEEKEFLSLNPIVFYDIGARGSAPEELIPFYSNLEYYAFDADVVECNRLNTLPNSYSKFTALPYFVGGNIKREVFNLYRERSHSSVFKPGTRYKELFSGDGFAVDKEVKIESITMDEIYAKEASDLPDFIKLDTQGSELEILQASKSVLQAACLIEVEVEFLEVYDGQPLFHDVAKFMNDNGFELLCLSRAIGQRSQIFNGPSRGQVIFGDTLFGRREDFMQDIEISRMIKYVLLLINYGCIDFAYHLIKLFPNIKVELPSIGRYFKKNNHGSFIKRMLISQFDKLLMMMLHFRKYNQLEIDSDRSWPFR